MTGKKTNKTKDEFPPLLGGGFHITSADDLRGLVVDAFPQSQRRSTLWNNFLSILSSVEKAGIPCDIWIDGSFLTKKIDPDDIDLVFDIPLSLLTIATTEQSYLVQQLAAKAFCKDYKIHSFVIFNVPAGHTYFGKYQTAWKYWEGAFGKSFVKKEPKGIALIEVRP